VGRERDEELALDGDQGDPGRTHFRRMPFSGIAAAEAAQAAAQTTARCPRPRALARGHLGRRAGRMDRIAAAARKARYAGGSSATRRPLAAES
jgi:hypothetical protein